MFDMKYIFLVMMLIIMGCTETPEYNQENFSEPVVQSTYLKCNINGIDHYTDGVLIYHKSLTKAKVVYSPIGEYYQPLQYPRWQLRIYLDRNDSVYNKTWEYINNRELPNGDPVVCITEDVIPSGFREFLSSHEGMFDEFREKEAIEFD